MSQCLCCGDGTLVAASGSWPTIPLMTIQRLDRVDEYEVICNECEQRMRLQEGEMVLSSTPTLSARLNWRTDTTTEPHQHFCPEHHR